MKLVTTLILRCAAALALAAATDDRVMPAPQPTVSQEDYRWPSSVVPPTASWANLFSSSWR